MAANTESDHPVSHTMHMIYDFDSRTYRYIQPERDTTVTVDGEVVEIVDDLMDQEVGYYLSPDVRYLGIGRVNDFDPFS